MKKINYCSACGKIIDKYGNIKLQLCSKHYQQFRRFGEVKDHNQRTVWDDNEIRILDTYAEIDTYDVKYLSSKKWRTVYKGRNNMPYLVTGHTIYFHRLIMGDPNCEIDHIDRNTHNNCKKNLRFASRQEQLYNTLRDNKSGIKGLYYNPNRSNKPWHCEFCYNGIKYYSPQTKTKEEAAYYRYLFETIFMKDMLICNTQELHEFIKSLTDEQKIVIQKYFRNKMKV